MHHQLEDLLNDARTSIARAPDPLTVEQLRVHYLGKKGQLTTLLKSVADLPVADRPEMGKVINQAKQELQSLLDQQEILLNESLLKQRLQSETIDITLPGRGQQLGALSSVTLIRERVIQLFTAMGFSIEDGPEIEDEYHNF